MKTVVIQFALLLAMIGLASAIDVGTAPLPSPPTDSAVAANDWRRTAQGWERMSTWPATNQARPARDMWDWLGAIHPSTVACLQCLLSLGAFACLGPTAATGPAAKGAASVPGDAYLS